MARSRRRRAKTRATRPKRRRAPSPPPRARARRASAETLLLDLARRVAAVGMSADPTAGMDAIVGELATTYAPDAPLATALRDDWLRGHGDKTARLALAWAREQVRLAVAEVLQHARAKRTLRPDGDVDTLAWLLLAACEALAHEPASAVSDRTQALVAFLRAP